MPTERLQKVLAAAGVASRRASETLIAAGRVTVDGKPATDRQAGRPANGRSIAVDGRVIGGAAAPAYLLLHKPAGVTSTARDRHADDDRPRPDPDGARPRRRPPVPGRPARPGLARACSS